MVTHISHIETGNSVPSLKTLIDIIKRAGLFGGRAALY